MADLHTFDGAPPLDGLPIWRPHPDGLPELTRAAQDRLAQLMPPARYVRTGAPLCPRPNVHMNGSPAAPIGRPGK